MTANTQLSALVQLIADATKVVEAHYATTAKQNVPPLDDVEPYPFDHEEILPQELRNAIQTIEGACAQLSATVARPSHTIVNKLMGAYEPACLGVVLAFKIPDILLEQPSGMTVTEIGQKAGIDEQKLGRVLRLLATKHCFKEVSKNVFANNRISIQLLSDNAMSNLGLHFTDECAKATSLLSEVLADPELGPSYSPEHTAFNKALDYPKSLFDYYGDAQGIQRGRRFGLGMMGWGKAIESEAVITANFQDLPDCIKQAKNTIWPNECPEAIRENRIEFKAMDFFNEPPIKGCDVYYLKNIIHDWPDADCVKIFQQVQKAMGPNSRVLIHEYVLQYANRVPEDQAEIPQAPEPLLPNYGAGRIRQYNLDLDMMTMLNSQERTSEDIAKLGIAAGLKFERVWDVGEMSLVELRLP